MKTTDILGLPGRGFPLLAGDCQGLFMSCHAVTAEYVAKRLGHIRILEICCGVGAITAALSREAEIVFAVDEDLLRIRCAQINLETYGKADRVTFRVTDALSEELWSEAKPNVVFADPDWAKSGDDKDFHTPSLAETQPPVPDILNMARKLGVPGVVLRLSPVSDLSQLAEWRPYEAQKVFVNGLGKYWLVYFGTACEKPGMAEDLQLFSTLPLPEMANFGFGYTAREILSVLNEKKLGIEEDMAHTDQEGRWWFYDQLCPVLEGIYTMEKALEDLEGKDRDGVSVQSVFRSRAR